jgi:Mn-dependent DtxR family transcriptional regulator
MTVLSVNIKKNAERWVGNMKKISITIPDELDKAIISELNKEYSTSFQKIAAKLNITRQLVSLRIKKLKQEGLLVWKFELKKRQY